MCPEAAEADPIFEQLWPHCPMYFPVIGWGGLCQTPRCMQPCRITEAAGPDALPERERRFTYDADGRVTRVDTETASGRWHALIRYDAVGRPLDWLAEDGTGRHYRYDREGRPIAMRRTLAPGEVEETTFRAGPHGMVERETIRDGVVILRRVFTFGDDGAIERHEDFRADRIRDASLPGDGLTLTYHYEYQPGRLARVRNERSVTQFTRDQALRVVARSRGPHPLTTYSYDDAGRLAVEDARPLDVSVGYVVYSYDCD